MEGCSRIEVRINNFEKYNPRGDVKKPTWFRLEYTAATSEALFDLTFEERWVFISLLAFTVEKVSHGEISCRADWFARHYGVSPGAVKSAIRKLIDSGTLITMNADVTPTEVNVEERSRDEHVTSPNDDVTHANADVTTRDGTRRDELNTCASADADSASEPAIKKRKRKQQQHGYSPAFESVYQRYPRKLGKSQGWRIYLRDVHGGDAHTELEAAVGRFCEYHRAKGTKPDFIPHFSTFMGQWRDWLEPDVGDCDAAKPQRLVLNLGAG